MFDSAPLDRDLEILGYPLAKIRVSADVPVAQIAVRLTEVTPEGKSWLVSYNVLNLTHRESMEKPTALKPGEFYDIELPLYMIAHRFKKGSRIRAAISESLWPLIWPSPQIATLDIALGASHLVLPVRPVPAREAPFTIPVIHAEQASKKGGGGYANGLQWVKAPLTASNRAQMPIRDADGTDPLRQREPTLHHVRIGRRHDHHELIEAHHRDHRRRPDQLPHGVGAHAPMAAR